MTGFTFDQESADCRKLNVIGRFTERASRSVLRKSQAADWDAGEGSAYAVFVNVRRGQGAGGQAAVVCGLLIGIGEFDQLRVASGAAQQLHPDQQPVRSKNPRVR